MTLNSKLTTYTGDVPDVNYDPSQEYTAESQEIIFSEEQHTIWADLFAGINQPHLLEHVCQEFIDGCKLLALDPQQIPSIAHLNHQINPLTGWRVERTAVRYTPADDWYIKFAQRVFLVTDYLRTRDQMEFTPEPDMFHDIFGHLPFLTQKFYAHLEDKFAPVYLKATREEKEVIKRLAWYTTEFGLVIQDNRFKIFGAGIISGRAEFANIIMEFYRLDRDNVIDFKEDVFTQLQEQFDQHKNNLDRFITGINQLHQKGEMSSHEQGWNVVQALYDELGIARQGYLGGEVVLAPLNAETIAKIPKTVYAFNPMYFVAESFDQMNAELDSYFLPILQRDA